ncbi:MAG TPA: pepsin/retropepsin-like aspartic protease family protein [Thermoanaerobaculia bacterium]|jgi:tetratricopeptide (TPR) repeat protein
MSRRLALLVLLLAAGCTLYNEVSIVPLNLLPSNIERGSDLQSMLHRADYLRAIELAPSIAARPRRTANDLAAIGAAYLAAGRFDQARAALRDGLDLEPFRTTYAQIAWDLSQVEYLSNNIDASLEWAHSAVDHGLNVRQWHIDYLQALVNTPVYRFSGAPHDSLPFHFGRPEVPRVTTRANGRETPAIIDSGAVLSIMSERLASSLPIRRLQTSPGTFFGLLGEPIPVSFGLVDRLELGAIVIENVPVAIMPDDKMKFLINKKEKEEYRIDFLLGSALLKEFRLELDFNRRRATFTHLTARDHQAGAEQNLFFEGFRPHVRGAVNRRGWFLFVLDTGSEITFLNQSKLASLPVHLFGSTGHNATLQGLGGAMKHGAKIENVEIGLGHWAGTFKTLPMYSSEEKEQAVGIIGQNFLKNFNVVIDYGTMRVDVERR